MDFRCTIRLLPADLLQISSREATIGPIRAAQWNPARFLGVIRAGARRHAAFARHNWLHACCPVAA